MPYILADPQSKLNYAFDWITDGWLQDGDAITAHQWSISPLNTGSPETPILTGATTDVVYVEAMEAGKIYHLSDRVTTQAGLTDERTVVIRCGET